MCDDYPHVPELTAEAAAGRLADRLDVPELTAGLLDRERDREAQHYLKTTPGWRSGALGHPDNYRDPADPGPGWRFVHDPRPPGGWWPGGPLIRGLPEV